MSEERTDADALRHYSGDGCPSVHGFTGDRRPLHQRLATLNDHLRAIEEGDVRCEDTDWRAVRAELGRVAIDLAAFIDRVHWCSEELGTAVTLITGRGEMGGDGGRWVTDLRRQPTKEDA